MADEMNNPPDDAAVPGEELGHQTPRQPHGLVDSIMNLGSEAGQKLGHALEHLVHGAENVPTDLGHEVAHDSHNLAVGIHNTVVGGAQHVESGAGHLLHPVSPAPPTGNAADSVQAADVPPADGETTV
ncbi:MAG TPA: hypothetical protein VKY74_13350 [Chloroflexia bacterium]|nr:hypothetical protein [Chloroflexia bacterium]